MFQVMARVVTALLPSFGVASAFRAISTTGHLGKSRFTPSPGWLCMIEPINGLDWEELSGKAAWRVGPGSKLADELD
jgi:hypothetical protein